MYSSEQQKTLFDDSKTLVQSAFPTDEAAARAQAEMLRKVIIYHEWRYYVLHQPVLSDFEFDTLFKRLKDIEAQYPQLIVQDSPTQRVSSDLTEEFATVAHLTPMLSLENSYNADDLNDFDKRVKKLLQLDENADVAYVVEPKFDGGTIVLYYENDQLMRAATRGNGVQGDDITNNAKAVRSIPLQANFSKYNIQKAELRGEVLMSKASFERVNQKRLANGEELFANPRNAATGGIRQKDAKQVAERSLDAFVYQLGFAASAAGESQLSQFGTHDETIEALGALGFKIPQPNVERKLCKNIAEVVDFCQQWEIDRDAYGYEIDGMVIKLNELALQDKCGYTSHHPRWAIAFKFKAKQATTKLQNIEFWVGRTGAITPVAKLDTVELAGVQVSSVSLHNAEQITQKDIRIGDTVLVERAGDVIPQIVKPLVDLRNGTEEIVIFPTQCPDCQTSLERPEGEAVWRCPNTTGCPAQRVQQFIHFASKDAMNIDGMGEAIVERFYKEGWLQSLTDIYKLDYTKIATLEGFGKRSAEKLKNAIENSKQNPAARLLFGLGVRYIGKSSSKTLVAAVEKLQDLAAWSVEDLMKLEDVGTKTAQQVFEAFAKPETIALLNELEALGVNTSRLDEEKKREASADAPLSGKTILFTGTLSRMTRDEAKAKAEAAGGKVVGSVSAKLAYLVVGEDAGSKLQKARDLNIAILSEDEFLALIGEANSL